MLQTYVSSVSDVSEVCCNCLRLMLQSRSECCICCNGCTRMLQSSVPNVSFVFLEVLDVAYVSHICCKCLIWMLRLFPMVFKCFSCVFAHKHVSSVSFVFRRMLQVLHLNIFKSRSGVAHVAMRTRSEGDASGLVARAPHGHVKPRRMQGRAVFLCERGRRLLVWARKTTAQTSRHRPRVERSGANHPVVSKLGMILSIYDLIDIHCHNSGVTHKQRSQNHTRIPTKNIMLSANWKNHKDVDVWTIGRSPHPTHTHCLAISREKS